MSFDIGEFIMALTLRESQSLSSRAMSFDNTIGETMTWVERLNPFRAGRCLST